MYLDPYTQKQMHDRKGMFIHPGKESAGCIVMSLGNPRYDLLASWIAAEGGNLSVTE